MVVIPPADAKVVKPTTFNFAPIFTFFSTPRPPARVKAPESLVVESVVTLTKIPAFDWIDPLAAFKVKAPEFVVMVFVSTLTLPKVEIPVALRSFASVCPEITTIVKYKVSEVAL